MGKVKNRADGPITKPEDWSGSEAKEHYCRVKEAAEELKIPKWKVRYLLYKGLLEGVNVYKLYGPCKILAHPPHLLKRHLPMGLF